MRRSWIAIAAAGLAGATPTCSPQPLGPSGYVNSPDTADTFEANPAYKNAANGAVTPSGYDMVFQNLKASNNAPGYIWYERINSYDPSQCAARCNSIAGCASFNIYFERDPTLAPGPSCPNPSSTTYINCAYWSSAISSSNANNYGQYRNSFHVVIAGANGYVNQTYEVSQAASVIASSSLQPYCSQLLHYTQPISTSVVVSTSQPLTTITTTSTVTTNVVQQTQFAIVTVLATSTAAAGFHKRAATTNVVTLGPEGLPQIVRAASNATATAPEKRAVTTSAVGAVYTPPGLLSFPASVISSACSQEVKPATSTIITYTTTTTIEPAQTSTVVIDAAASTTSTVQETVTDIVTLVVPTPQCTQGSTFQIGVSNSGTDADGQYIRGTTSDDNILVAGNAIDGYPVIQFTIASDGTLRTTDGHYIEWAGAIENDYVVYESSNNDYAFVSCTIGAGNVLSCSSTGSGSGLSFQGCDGGFNCLVYGEGGQTTLTAVC